MPQHQHDCTQCRFLGSLGTTDLYICQHDDSPTYLVRFSSEPSHYSSHSDFKGRVQKVIRAEIGGGDDLMYERLTVLRLSGVALTNLMKME